MECPRCGYRMFSKSFPPVLIPCAWCGGLYATAEMRRHAPQCRRKNGPKSWPAAMRKEWARAVIRAVTEAEEATKDWTLKVVPGPDQAAEDRPQEAPDHTPPQGSEMENNK